VKNEWISAGNIESTFSEDGPLILIILDNASYQKKKIIVEAIEKELPNIQLYFLPAYSPDMNLVELVWHSAKEYIAHRLFKSVEELRNLSLFSASKDDLFELVDDSPKLQGN
jgi:transposase